MKFPLFIVPCASTSIILLFKGGFVPAINIVFVGSQARTYYISYAQIEIIGHRIISTPILLWLLHLSNSRYPIN